MIRNGDIVERYYTYYDKIRSKLDFPLCMVLVCEIIVIYIMLSVMHMPHMKAMQQPK